VALAVCDDYTVRIAYLSFAYTERKRVVLVKGGGAGVRVLIIFISWHVLNIFWSSHFF